VDMLPTVTLQFQSKYWTPWHISSNDRIIMLCCAGATSSCKINICIVCNKIKPHSKDLKVQICLLHTFIKRNIVGSFHFITVFDTFVPQTHMHLRMKGLPVKAVVR
jgi:hypothetical protein